jgi:hypothetical protein
VEETLMDAKAQNRVPWPEEELTEEEDSAMELGASRIESALEDMQREAHIAPELMGCYYSGVASALAGHMLGMLGQFTTAQILQVITGSVRGARPTRPVRRRRRR